MKAAIDNTIIVPGECEHCHREMMIEDLTHLIMISRLNSDREVKHVCMACMVTAHSVPVPQTAGRDFSGNVKVGSQVVAKVDQSSFNWQVEEHACIVCGKVVVDAKAIPVDLGGGKKGKIYYCAQCEQDYNFNDF